MIIPQVLGAGAGLLLCGCVLLRVLEAHAEALGLVDGVGEVVGVGVGAGCVEALLRPGTMLCVERERPDFPKTTLGMFFLVNSLDSVSLYWPGPGVKLFSTMLLLFCDPITAACLLTTVLVLVS